ncbi:hypothetical protein GJAV_G00226510 [Gymnothorax javanicus]|nr:hypothetical protein GJAV_G00226510 [Gymnothorax javanicus]
MLASHLNPPRLLVPTVIATSHPQLGTARGASMHCGCFIYSIIGPPSRSFSLIGQRKKKGVEDSCWIFLLEYGTRPVAHLRGTDILRPPISGPPPS